MIDIPPAAGSYVLWLRAAAPRRIQVGRLGLADFPVGDYLYCGSAAGPGGLRARIRHHIHPALHPHWHLDWVRPPLVVKSAWWVLGAQRLECRWAAGLAQIPGVSVPLARFGAADCQNGCAAHLLFFGTMGGLSIWRNLIEEAIERLSGPGINCGGCDFSGSVD
jgi:Uri superfamily endonuclease